MRISAVLILYKEFGCGSFAYIVVESSYPCQKPVTADNPARLFGKLSDGVRVLICSGGS